MAADASAQQLHVAATRMVASVSLMHMGDGMDLDFPGALDGEGCGSSGSGSKLAPLMDEAY